jgi:hypothetical protein
MRHAMLASLALLAVVPALWGLDDDKDKQKAPTPREQYQSIIKEYAAAVAEYRTAMQQAKTNEERQKVYQEKLPRADKYAPRMLELAEKNPDDPVAVDAAVWVVNSVRTGKEADRAFGLLVAHPDDKRVGNVCAAAGASSSPAAEEFLRAVLEKSKQHDARGLACFGLAENMKKRSGQADKSKKDELAKEAEALYERVIKEFADVKRFRGSLGDQAKGGLNDLHHVFDIGKVAPEIAGEDLDGKPFKLSDYRGKVVMLDFWGHW